MRGIIAVFVLFTVVNIAYGCGTNGKCPKGWITRGTKCYKLFKGTKSFHDADKLCEKNGGHLPCPVSAKENKFLHSVIKGKRSWLGIHDKNSHKTKRGKEGTFRCIAGHQKIKYKSWQRGEPNNHGRGEDCVEMYFRKDWGRNRKWNDISCGHKNHVVCEYHVDK